jgi:hypothetical protein
VKGREFTRVINGVKCRQPHKKIRA